MEEENKNEIFEKQDISDQTAAIVMPTAEIETMTHLHDKKPYQLLRSCSETRFKKFSVTKRATLSWEEASIIKITSIK
mgnify:CR=1 FL=1